MRHLDALLRDLRYASRVLLKRPGFTVAAVATLALCIGANTAIYTVVDRVLLRPLPYPDPERLAAVVTQFERGDGQAGQTGSAWLALKDAAAIDLAVMSDASVGVNFAARNQAEYVRQQRVSAGLFRVLGVAPALGREFTEDEDRVNGAAVAILSHPLWTRAFGADPGVVGKPVTLRGEPCTVVGVMPAGFRTDVPADVWTPLRPSPRGEGSGQNYAIIGRLRPGVTWAEADSRIAAAGARTMVDLYPNANARQHLIPLQTGLTQSTRQPLLILWGAVAMVLLIGCVNIAGLLLAQAATRTPEIATRIALGGGRATIVRQLLAESVVLAVCGGLAGVALGYFSLQIFASLLEDAFGVTGEVGLDQRVLAATGAASLLTSLVFGLFPAFQASRVDLRAAIVESGGTTIAGTANRWPRRVMVTAEVALGVVLLVGAGLLIRTFDHLVQLRAGFDGTNVVTATLSLQDARYTTSQRVTQLFDESLARMRSVPGVESAAVCLTLPYERALNMPWRFVGADSSDRLDVINLTYVTPQYFDTLRIPLTRGRIFTDADNASAAPAIVVNQAFVRRHSQDQDAIGRQVAMGGKPNAIVGVVGDIQQKAGWGDYGPVAAIPAAYAPAAQMSDGWLALVHTWFSPSWIVRTRAAQAGIAAKMQSAVQRVDPQLPFASFRTLDQVRGRAVATQRAQAVLLGSLAALALLLAAVGIYGLVASSVTERTRELGIRMALGATPIETIRVAALPGLMLGAAGVAIGLALARMSTSVMRHLVWGVSVADPLTFAFAASAVLLVASVAALVPSLRILRLNPVRALRK